MAGCSMAQLALQDRGSPTAFMGCTGRVCPMLFRLLRPLLWTTKNTHSQAWNFVATRLAKNDKDIRDNLNSAKNIDCHISR